jgi:hypothetical protein
MLSENDGVVVGIYLISFGLRQRKRQTLSCLMRSSLKRRILQIAGILAEEREHHRADIGDVGLQREMARSGLAASTRSRSGH